MQTCTARVSFLVARDVSTTIVLVTMPSVRSNDNKISHLRSSHMACYTRDIAVIPCSQSVITRHHQTMFSMQKCFLFASMVYVCCASPQSMTGTKLSAKDLWRAKTKVPGSMFLNTMQKMTQKCSLSRRHFQRAWINRRCPNPQRPPDRDIGPPHCSLCCLHPR